MKGAQVVDTHALAVGDVVTCHGSKFRLVTRRQNGDVVAFTCEYLGPMWDAAGEAIPAHWRSDWVVQGNQRAHWARLEVQP